MKKRLKIQQLVTDCHNLLLKLESLLTKSPLERKHNALIKLRASQKNGCAFCLHMHLQEALQIGEDINRITLLSAWRDSANFFDEHERAVLELTERVSLIAHGEVDDELYDRCPNLFGEAYTAHLILDHRNP